MRRIVDVLYGMEGEAEEVVAGSVDVGLGVGAAEGGVGGRRGVKGIQNRRVTGAGLNKR